MQVKSNEYCLSYLLSHRNYRDNVLGLAYVAAPKKQNGGICHASLNTGIVTTLNKQRSPLATSQLVFIHEIGHSMGAGVSMAQTN